MGLHLIDRWCILTTIASFIFSLVLFWDYSEMPFFSFIAAVLSAGLFFTAYIVLRMLVLSLYK